MPAIITNNAVFITAISLTLISSVLVSTLYTTTANEPDVKVFEWTGDYFGPANANEAPLPLIDSVIWHQAGQQTLLWRDVESGNQRSLLFANGNPIWWDAVPARPDEDEYHFAWLTDQGDLVRTLITSFGDSTFSPITVASDVDAVAWVTSGNGWTPLAWRSNGNLSLSVLDVFGRPLVRWDNLAEQIDRIALIGTLDGPIYMAYTTGTLLHTTYIDELTQQPTFNTRELSIADTAWIDDLHLISIDNSAPDIIWLTRDITSPNQATLHAQTWDGNAVMPGATIHPTQLGTSYSTSPNHELPLIALSNQLQAAWFRWDDQVLQTIAGPPASVSAPRIWFDNGDTPQLATWTTQVDGAFYHYVTYPKQQVVIVPPPSARQWLANGLMQAYRGLGWLLLPIFLSFSTPAIREQISATVISIVVLISYSVLKLILSPAGLYAAPPISDISSGLLLLGVGAMSIVIASLWSRTTRLIWAVVFITSDALLTFIMFGGNLS